LLFVLQLLQIIPFKKLPSVQLFAAPSMQDVQLAFCLEHKEHIVPSKYEPSLQFKALAKLQFNQRFLSSVG
jgi:hypothetical protein